MTNSTPDNNSKKGIELENLSWQEAEKVLDAETVIILPLGGQLKEHGPHLPLNNDWILARYLTGAVLERLPVVALPPLNYSYYPAMVDYPGTVSLQKSTALALIVEIVESIANFGPRAFYCLNTGISTMKPLAEARDILENRGLQFDYTDMNKHLTGVRKLIEEQPGGGHADEIETSLMLAIAPDIVHLDKARPDFHGNASGPLQRTRNEDKPGVYSPTGSWGDPTKALAEKGHQLLDALLEGIVKDIQNISQIRKLKG